MNLREILESLTGVDTERTLDLAVGGVKIEGTIITKRLLVTKPA